MPSASSRIWNARPRPIPSSRSAAQGLIARAGDDATELKRTAQEGAGLPVDHREVLVDRHETTFVREVERLTFDHFDRRLGQARRSGGAAPRDLARRHRVEEVAGVDRFRLAMRDPQSRPAAPRPIAVLDVVVNEREVVDEFERHSRWERGLDLAAELARREENERRSQELAGSVDWTALLVFDADVLANEKRERRGCSKHIAQRGKEQPAVLPEEPRHRRPPGGRHLPWRRA